MTIYNYPHPQETGKEVLGLKLLRKPQANKIRRFNLSRKKCLTLRMVKHWSRLWREIAEYPSLEA